MSESMQKDSTYYFGPLITFQVEDTLFRVLRRDFEEQSEFFANLLSNSANNVDDSQDGVGVGQDDEHPLRLDGVTTIDFRCFLRTSILRRSLPSCEPLNDTELETALHLATTWHFDKLREVLIRDLENLNLQPARKLQLARTYDISKWYKQELRLLALRPSSLTSEEGNQLGTELAVIVSVLRDERYRAILQCQISAKRSLYDDVASIEQSNQADIEEKVDRKLSEFCQTRGWEQKPEPTFTKASRHA